MTAGSGPGDRVTGEPVDCVCAARHKPRAGARATGCAVVCVLCRAAQNASVGPRRRLVDEPAKRAASRAGRATPGISGVLHEPAESVTHPRPRSGSQRCWRGANLSVITSNATTDYRIKCHHCLMPCLPDRPGSVQVDPNFSTARVTAGGGAIRRCPAELFRAVETEPSRSSHRAGSR